MSENQLINKRYYEQYLSENEIAHPIRVLGEAYMKEQKNEIPDLTDIRFAQGEVYFHHKDFESAIFKWENISNDLEPWAKKNMADAFLELELYKNAEETYKSITTDSVLLNTEIGLQLFSLYIEMGNLDSAFKIIKKVVALNPDYLNVTELARDFFESQQDWQSAVELVVSEAIRTEQLQWFDFLKDYVENGYTKTIEPSFFTNVLIVLYGVDRNRFEDLITLLSKNYQNDFAWIAMINELFEGIEVTSNLASQKISDLLKETYYGLMNGQFLTKQLNEVIPKLLTNWIKMTGSQIASATILAWNEVFPGALTTETVNDAEHRFHHSQHQQVTLKEIIRLFDSISKWAGGHDVQLDFRLEWLIGELTDLRKRHLLLAEMSGNGKSAFINFVLGDNVSRAQTSTTVMYQYQRDMDINELLVNEIKGIADLPDFHSRSTIHRQSNEGRSVIDFKIPCPFLYNNKLAIIDTPGFSGNSYDREEVMHYLHAADSMMFLLNAQDPLTGKELEVLLQIREQMPDLNIHFLLKIDKALDVISLIENTKLKVNQYFPKASVFPFSTEMGRKEQELELARFIETHISYPPLEQERIEKLLYYMRKAITDLLAKRIEVENSLQTSIDWSEEMLSKLNGAIHQLEDLEGEKTKSIQKFYSERKNEIKAELRAQIPKLLRECSELISEESDFSNINQVLNDEMNNRIQEYLKKNILPRFYEALKYWIDFSESEFQLCQAILDERSEGFNVLFKDERMVLNCDFKVLDDWRRDADRMTSGISMDKVNILLKFTPTQFLLRSAGKLLGSISQNKTMLHNKYKSFVENENYEEATDKIVTKFLAQFDLFEKSLERDLKLFFKNPFRILRETVEETKQLKQTNESELTKLKENPELFRDPLTVFELRVRQYEWMMVAVNNPTFISM
jgi:tetratricopeptide (TPR) repeat protein